MHILLTQRTAGCYFTDSYIHEDCLSGNSFLSPERFCSLLVLVSISISILRLLNPPNIIKFKNLPL